MFSRIQVNHFRSIESADIELGGITIFVGNNGSGKSNIVDAIRFMRDATQHGMDRAVSDRHGVESIRQWSPTRPFQISLSAYMEEADLCGRYAFALDSAKGHFQVSREECEMFSKGALFDESDEPSEDSALERFDSFHRNKTGVIKKTSAHRVVPMTKKFDRNSFIMDDNVTYEIQDERTDLDDELWVNLRPGWGFASMRRRLSNFQAYSIFPNTLRTPQEPSNETYLASEGRNLTSVFKRMRRTKRGVDALNQINEGMRAILPNLERISILSVGGFLVPQFHMVEASGKKHVFNVSQMSDGTLRVLGILTALYQDPRPAMIALEEPEQTINPGILTVVADSIKEVSKRTQVVVTTHSPHLLDQFEPDTIRAVEYVAGKTRVGSISPTQIGVVRDRLFSLGELLVSEGLTA